MPRRRVPERDVKKCISAYLDDLPLQGLQVYYRMPVPSGYGTSGIDYEGCISGLYFGIEAKSPDDDAGVTPRQRETLLDILAGGGKAFIISRQEGMDAFQRWVDRCCRT